jgi:hypothetical protein
VDVIILEGVTPTVIVLPPNQLDPHTPPLVMFKLLEKPKINIVTEEKLRTMNPAERKKLILPKSMFMETCEVGTGHLEYWKGHVQGDPVVNGISIGEITFGGQIYVGNHPYSFFSENCHRYVKHLDGITRAAKMFSLHPLGDVTNIIRSQPGYSLSFGSSSGGFLSRPDPSSGPGQTYKSRPFSESGPTFSDTSSSSIPVPEHVKQRWKDSLSESRSVDEFARNIVTIAGGAALGAATSGGLTLVPSGAYGVAISLNLLHPGGWIGLGVALGGIGVVSLWNYCTSRYICLRPSDKIDDSTANSLQDLIHRRMAPRLC